MSSLLLLAGKPCTTLTRSSHSAYIIFAVWDLAGVGVIYFAAVETKVHRESTAEKSCALMCRFPANTPGADGRDLRRKVTQEIQSRTCRPGADQGQGRSRSDSCIEEQRWYRKGTLKDRFMCNLLTVIAGHGLIVGNWTGGYEVWNCRDSSTLHQSSSLCL